MKKEDIDRLIKNNHCIPGIYNYCDGWCARCPLSSRCLTCLMTEGRMGTDTEDCDLTNELFWQNLADMLKLALEMIRDEAEELGLDLDTVIDGPDSHRRRDAAKDIVHAVAFAAKSYGTRVDAWFASEYRALADMTVGPPVQLVEGGQRPGVVDAVDALEVIRWYQHQIYIKICRALRSTESRNMPDTDADGSAKVALIGIDRSISAWTVLLQGFPDSKNTILPLVTMLEGLRQRLEAAFPQARSFPRPGFDK